MTGDAFWRRGTPMLMLMVACSAAFYWYALTAPAASHRTTKAESLVCGLDHRDTLRECVLGGKPITPWGTANQYAVEQGAFCASFGNGRTWAAQVCVPDK